MSTSSKVTAQIVDLNGNPISSTGGALDINLKTPSTIPVSLGSSGNDTSAIYISSLAQQDFQQSILSELRAIRMAMVALATEGGKNKPDDFNPLLNDFSNSGNLN